jgi:hypothetical protein
VKLFKAHEKLHDAFHDRRATGAMAQATRILFIVEPNYDIEHISGFILEKAYGRSG